MVSPDSLQGPTEARPPAPVNWRGALLAATVLAGGCGALAPRPLDPLTAEEHNDLGVAYHAQGRYALAVREFRRVTALRPGWPRGFVNLGDALVAAGDAEGAIAAYEAARAAGADDPATANNLAWALLQHPSRWPEAETLVRMALARDPTPRGYYLDTLGLVLLRKGEPQEALRAFRAALADRALRERRARALILSHAGDALERVGDALGAGRCRALARDLGEPGGAPPEIEAVGGSDAVC